MNAQPQIAKRSVSQGAKQRILKSMRGSVVLTSLAFAVDNFVALLRPRNAMLTFDEHLGGHDIDADAGYARQVAEFYLSQGPLDGKVAEIGPGGSAAVALHLVAHGTDQVELLDRFSFVHDAKTQARLYEEIARRLSADLERPLPVDSLLARIDQFIGDEAAAEVFFRDRSGYSAITSCAVFEHLYDPMAALDAMTGALKPGGWLLHQVDLRDHGMYSAGGHHPLAFLSIPSWFYRLMSRRRGRPNRVPLPCYRERLEKLGVDFDLLVNDLVGVGEVAPSVYSDIDPDLRRTAEASVEAFRSKLAPEFRDLPAADLAVAGFRIVARKPAAIASRDKSRSAISSEAA